MSNNKLFYGTRFLIILLTALITISYSSHSFAQQNFLDATFGTNGSVTAEIGNISTVGNSVVFNSDGKIIISYQRSNSDNVLARYNSDGTLDATFGIGGIIVSNVTGSIGSSLVILNDQKILSAGPGLNVVLRNEDGILENSFGTNGISITNLQNFYGEKCNSIAVQNDGKILLGGYANHFSSDVPHFILLRFNSNGTLDSSFGNGGKIIGGKGKAYSVDIQNDGKILIAGDSSYSFALERYNTNGTLDSTFGINGKVITHPTANGIAYSCKIQNDGKIVLAGYHSFFDSNNLPSSKFTMVRYTSDGTLDSSFGSNGIAIGGVGKPYSMNIGSNGEILLGGYCKIGGVYSFGLERHNNDGSLDNSFGIGGKINTPIGDYSTANSLGIDSNGKIVLAGLFNDGAGASLALTRYLGEASNAINENENLFDFNLFPNPFDAFAAITFNTPVNNAELTIYNAYGQIVKQLVNISGEKIQFSRGSLPSGFYYIQLTEKNRISEVGKFVISDD